MRKYVVLLALFLLPSAAPAQALNGEARLLRFPATHGDQVVFTYAGNLCTVPVFATHADHAPPGNMRWESRLSQRGGIFPPEGTEE